MQAQPDDAETAMPQTTVPQTTARKTPAPPTGRHPWLTGRAIRLHVFTIIVVVGCVALGWWQLKRGEAGNMRSYAYALEWPFFACAAGYMWFRTLREDTAAAGMTATTSESPVPGELPAPDASGWRQAALARQAEEPDPELDAYNDYLASLNQLPR